MAVVGTAGRGLIVYQLEGGPQEYKRIDSPLKYQHRCVAIFKDKKKQPTGMNHSNKYYNFISCLSFFVKIKL